MSAATRRCYDFRCRQCGTEETRTQTSDPQTILCRGCRGVAPIPWWRMRPEAGFTKPDLAGLVFGPTPEEIAETGRPFARRRDDVEDMRVKLRDEPLPEVPAEQLGLFGK